MADLTAFSRNPGLVRRVGLTLCALAIYQIGCWVPLPGVDVRSLGAALAPSVLGSAVERVSLMALGVMPLLTVLVLVEAAKMIWPPVKTWSSEPENRTHLDGWVLWGALALAALQANGIATALEEIRDLVPSPGIAFRAGVVASMVAATAVLVGLASFITRHGVGSGFWILFAVPHAVSFAETLLAQAATLGPVGLATISVSVGFLALSVAVLAALTKTRPPLAKADELIWAPVLGFAVANWLLAAVLLVRWLTLPTGQGGDFDTILSGPSALILPLVAVPLVVVLRRRAGAPLTASDVVSAAPLAGALAALVLIGTLIAHMPGLPVFVGPATTLILAAVGLAVAEGLAQPAEPH